MYSRNPDRRQAFARAWSAQFGIDVRPVDSAKAAVADSDIVIVATNTGMNGPVAYEGAWLEPDSSSSRSVRRVPSDATSAETFDRAAHQLDASRRNSAGYFDGRPNVGSSPWRHRQNRVSTQAGQLHHGHRHQLSRPGSSHVQRSAGCVDRVHFDTGRLLAAVRISALQPSGSLTVWVTALPPGWW